MKQFRLNLITFLLLLKLLLVLTIHHGKNESVTTYGGFFPGFPGIGGGGGSSNNRENPHPLDPLTEAEIRSTVQIINRENKERTRRRRWTFVYVTLHEPLKSDLLSYFLNDNNPPQNLIPRKSFSLIMDSANMKAFEVIVNLDSRQIESWTNAPWDGVPFTFEEHETAEYIAKSDRNVRERCRRLGWTDMDSVVASSGILRYNLDVPEYEGKRLHQVYFHGKHFRDDNFYAHPFDFSAIVDTVERKVLKIEELPTHDDFTETSKEGTIVPQEECQWDPSLRNSTFRKDLKPVRISQDGTSFKINGNEISWQKFKFRLGFNGREGLVIYNVNYNDSGKVQPLFYRMSISEMLVPYGDPRSPYYRKQIFDIGEYGLGFTSNSLKAQVDCLGEVRFFDGVLHNARGEPKRVPKVICLAEEDFGILWKHTDSRTLRSAVVRAQRLVLTFIVTVGNYDYIFSWNFYLDGMIEFNVKLTGILNTNLISVNATPAGHGSTVFPQINAQYHQHFFNLRLDPEIGGNKNSVLVNDVVPGPGETGSEMNLFGTAFTVNRTLLRTAGESRTNVDVEKSRIWVITNGNYKNAYTNDPIAWKLMSWPSPKVFQSRDSTIHKPAEWTDYNTWVTPYREGEIYAGGLYLNNSGLPEWVRRDPEASIVNEDVVVWHNFGLTHIPRVEDWPAMPMESCGIFLKPYNFYLENPAMDVLPAGGRTKMKQ